MAKLLIGFMGAGKTTVGRLLSDQLYEMDDLLTAQIGMPITDFFQQEGEPAFRQLETALLKDLLALGDVWISPGGGLILSGENRQLLQGHEVVFLEADFETVYDRIRLDTDHQRPLFLNHSKEEFQAIFDSRQDLYRSLATLTVPVANLTPHQVAQVIKTILTDEEEVG